MNSMTFQSGPAVRVPMRALALINTVWAVGKHIGTGFAAAVKKHEPSTPEEVLAWAHELEATQPGFAADLRAAALAVQAGGQAAR
jgi:hypothetical protein